MSEDTERTPLATIEAFEALAFRVSQVARQLLAEHPDLPVVEIRPFVIAYCRTESTSTELQISTYDVDAVRAWAEALGTTVDVKFHDNLVRPHSHCFEYHQAKLTISGVKVSFAATRQPTEEEIQAWRNRRPGAAGAAGAAGAGFADERGDDGDGG